MNIFNSARVLVNKLSSFNPQLVVASTGSCYVHLTNSKIKYIRVADHKGHKESPRTWQLRSDVCSTRKGTNRIYNNIDRLVADLL